jgi:hypothetical protein
MIDASNGPIAGRSWDSEVSPVPVMNACLSAGTSNTAALRHIAKLVERGLVERKTDRYDSRRINLALTPCGKEQIEGFPTFCAQGQPTSPLEST